MSNKKRLCSEYNNNTSQNIFIPSLNSWYPIENVINSAYRKILDFKENAEKILEKEKLEKLSLNEFAKAIYDSRSFNVSLQHYCIVLKCYITLEKDVKKKRDNQSPPLTPVATDKSNQEYQRQMRFDSNSSSSDFGEILNLETPPVPIQASGGAKKVNVEVIIRSNPFRVDENEKSTKIELIHDETESGILRFTYYVKPEHEARKLNQEGTTDVFENGKLILFTNDFFTVYKNSNNGLEISLNEIVQSVEEKNRTEALGEKLFTLLKDRPRHRALLTNECKLNSHAIQYLDLNNNNEIHKPTFLSQQSVTSQATQEDEIFFTRELINIYGQPIVPSFHKHFNYQLSNTHYGYRTLRRLLNCDILKKYVKITREEIRNLDRVVEFVQLTTEKSLKAFAENLTTFYDLTRFPNGIVENFLDTWYIDRLKEMYNNKDDLYKMLTLSTNKTNFEFESLDTENIYDSDSLWFYLEDYNCRTIHELLVKMNLFISVKNNNSNLIPLNTIHPLFEYKEILSEARRILAICLNKSVFGVSLDEIITSKLPNIARKQVEILLHKYINLNSSKQFSSYTALFDILNIIRREFGQEKKEEIKCCQLLHTLEKCYQEKLMLAISQLKCVPFLNKYMLGSDNFLKQPSNYSNIGRLTKQMSSVVITELQIAIDLFERQENDKSVKYIRLKDEFKPLILPTIRTPELSSFLLGCQTNKLTTVPTLTIPKPAMTTSDLINNIPDNNNSNKKEEAQSLTKLDQQNILQQRLKIFNPRLQLAVQKSKEITSFEGANYDRLANLFKNTKRC